MSEKIEVIAEEIIVFRRPFRIAETAFGALRAVGWLKKNDSPREHDQQQSQHLRGTAHVLGLL